MTETLGLRRVNGMVNPGAFYARVQREVTPEDIHLLETTIKGCQPAPVKRLHARHHQAARMIALGNTYAQVAIATNYTPTVLSNLMRADPLFQALVEEYKSNLDQTFRDVQRDMLALGADAIEEIRVRLEEAPEEISTSQLLSIATAMADRTGNGPPTAKAGASVTVNIAARLEAARKNVAEKLTAMRNSSGAYEVVNDAAE